MYPHDQAWVVHNFPNLLSLNIDFPFTMYINFLSITYHLNKLISVTGFLCKFV